MGSGKLFLRNLRPIRDPRPGDERLEKVAEDIVSHFMGRSQMGKAMVIAIDKATAVRMFDKVQMYWRREIAHLMDEYAIARTGSPEAAELLGKLDYMQETDMAVVVSQGQNEVEEFRNKGLDIATHRRRINKEDLAKQFKGPDDRRHIVEELSEEELAIFDLLIKPDVTLSEKEKKEVKKVAHELLATLKQEQFSLDWRKRQQGRALVRLTIEEVLDHLPPVYSKGLYEKKCDTVYQHVYDSYYGGGRSVYVKGMVM